MNSSLAAVTARIEQRSADSRAAYLAHLAQAKKPGPYREGLACANAAHAYAAMPANDKLLLRQERQPHLGVVSAYNDMLSAHQPYEHRAWPSIPQSGMVRRRRASRQRERNVLLRP